MKRGYILPLLLFCALLLMGQTPHYKDVEIYHAPLHPQFLGLTLCENGKVIILIRADVDSLREQRVVIHERVHVRQTRKFGKCEDFGKKYRDDIMFRLGTEVEAYCPDIREQVKMESADGVTVRFATHIVRFYGDSSRIEAVKLLIRNCIERG